MGVWSGPNVWCTALRREVLEPGLSTISTLETLETPLFLHARLMHRLLPDRRKKFPSSSLKAMDGSLGECAHAPKPGCTAQIPYISSHSRASDLSWHLMTDSDFLPTQLLQVPGRDPKMVHRGTSAHVARKACTCDILVEILSRVELNF